MPIINQTESKNKIKGAKLALPLAAELINANSIPLTQPIVPFGAS